MVKVTFKIKANGVLDAGRNVSERYSSFIAELELVRGMKVKQRCVEEIKGGGKIIPYCVKELWPGTTKHPVIPNVCGWGKKRLSKKFSTPMVSTNHSKQSDHHID